jgi:hypothetical protein
VRNIDYLWYKFKPAKKQKNMRKEMYLIRGIENENYRQFTDRILKLADTVSELISPDALKVTLTREAPPTISVIPFKKKKIAVFSVYKENNTKVGHLINYEGFAGSFIVDEALPVSYDRTWTDGEPTPGACLLTLFHRKPGIDYDTFIDRWHNSHTPMSLRIHPLWNYNRNVVLQKTSDHPDWFDGIVEEHTRTKAELLNPFKFFGNALEILGNMLSVYTDTKSFIDYKRIETYLAMEYHIVSHQVYQNEISSQNQSINNQANVI